MTSSAFQHTNYLVRKQFFKLFGGKFRIYDPAGGLALFANMAAFKLREDIRLYTGEDMLHEVLTIKARSIIDFSAAYDVMDPTTGEKVGALKRKGLKSVLKDEWVIMDSVDNEIGFIHEDKWLWALLRRFVTNLIPQTYHGDMRGMPVFTFKQHFDPFVLKLDLDFSPDTGNLLDRRLGVAAAVLLCAIEGREKN